ncbi:MAG: hypothetical protein NT069_04230 [Planctomycetota bacterium]|nr:hypothetical protein [Planctomycetota bacterium]
MQQGVCVSVVDLVTTRQFNLYGELLSQFDRTDTAFLPKPPSTYAATCRCRRADHGSKLTTWAYPLSIGAPLPTLPIWLDEDECMSLELEASYEETCRALRIT